MKVAFTYNLRRTNSEDEAEFDTAETVDAIADAIEAAGHEVDKIEVSGPAAHLLERIEASDPDIIFNTAEGRGGRMREAFYPALFEEIGVPYTGSDAYAMALTLDKWLTKLVLLRHGIDTPRGRLINAENLPAIAEQGPGLAFPIIVKPNYEGSSKGIAGDSVANDFRELMTLLKAAVKVYPDGVLMEEYIEGLDIAVGYLHGVGLDDGLLAAGRVPARAVRLARVQRSTTTPRRTSSPTRSGCGAPRQCRATWPPASAPSPTMRSGAWGSRTSPGSTSASPTTAASTCSRPTRFPPWAGSRRSSSPRPSWA